uniref:Uncharacterized protein n=1 Tax=Chromera velia CCMP2878 TaxID=1169474 RepID=A0A0G4IDH5_9ALVE|eukprot:Cvel_13376.t1-p1 / transcript=Cvel_13376.t1 / gene=Cvel_13376 / organism=Chromera_velia_CCMP2878 / gene_product=hypothetical protein / transcript_product=hypothetical protein / location=Cvel_scaffold910:29334-32903(-) / protein_length=462 / sequence_SO=supercontig / SO=protein_coding / is_pseudo=false
MSVVRPLLICVAVSGSLSPFSSERGGPSSPTFGLLGASAFVFANRVRDLRPRGSSGRMRIPRRGSVCLGAEFDVEDEEGKQKGEDDEDADGGDEEDVWGDDAGFMEQEREFLDAHPLTRRFPKGSKPEGLPRLPARHFINLTNGIELLPVLQNLLLQPSQSDQTGPGPIEGPGMPLFCRIPSSVCEKKRPEKLLILADASLLFALACGHPCYVYDLGSRSKHTGVPRAVWQGLEFLKYALHYYWFGEFLESRSGSEGRSRDRWFWKECILKYRVEKKVKKRIRYFAKYAKAMGVREIRLYGVYGAATKIDGYYPLYARAARAHYEDTFMHGNATEHAAKTWESRGETQMDTENSDRGDRPSLVSLGLGDEKEIEKILRRVALRVFDPDSHAADLVKEQISVKKQVEPEDGGEGAVGGLEYGMWGGWGGAGTVRSKTKEKAYKKMKQKMEEKLAEAEQLAPQG